jgi:hypothetical protein
MVTINKISLFCAWLVLNTEVLFSMADLYPFGPLWVKSPVVFSQQGILRVGIKKEENGTSYTLY